MPSLYPYRLFISHAWSYGDHYDTIVRFLDQASNFNYRNYSVPEAKAFERARPTVLAEKLCVQIRPVQVAIILGGMYVAHSDWIQFEIDFAKEINKPLLGIQPWGSERMPRAVQNAADRIVGWNTSSIVSAIRELVP